jgi:hypothetical protein
VAEKETNKKIHLRDDAEVNYHEIDHLKLALPLDRQEEEFEDDQVTEGHS